MATVETTSASMDTVADLVHWLGDIPLNRIRARPAPGTAVLQDVIDIQSRQGRLCELVEGVLVEKAMGFSESLLTHFLAVLLDAFVRPRNLGLITGPDGTMELMANLVRIPDIAFTKWDRIPGGRRPPKPIPRLSPNLAVEILSASNTPREMELKRQDYFRAGVEVVWEVDPSNRTVAVFSSPDQFIVLGLADTLDGGTVLPGFTLSLRDLFAELDRHS